MAAGLDALLNRNGLRPSSATWAAAPASVMALAVGAGTPSVLFEPSSTRRGPSTRCWPNYSGCGRRCAHKCPRSDQPYRWDLFVAHAAHDIDFVRTLCRAMRTYHLRVWIDRDQLTLGDSIRRTIDTALPECRYGKVRDMVGLIWSSPE